MQSTLSRLQEASSAQIASLEGQLAARDSALSQAQDKLSAQRDYEEIKRELR